MTNRLLLILLYFMALPSFAQLQHGLHGRVKSTREHSYHPKLINDQWINGAAHTEGNQLFLFDEEGKYTEMVVTDSLGTIIMKLVPSYKNNKIGTEKIYDRDGKLLQTITMKWLSPTIVESVNKDADGKKINEGKTTYRNNRVQHVSYRVYKDNIVTGEFSAVLTYNTDNQLLSHKTTDSEGVITSFKEYRYLAFDRSNNWTKMLVYDAKSDKNPETIVIRQLDYY